MMANELSTLQEQMKERLRGQMAGMVPDEIWDKMIEAEFHHTFKELVSVKDPVTQEDKTITRFQYMIRQEIVENAKEQAKKVASDACASSYNYLTDEYKSEMISKALECNMQQLMANALSGLFHRVAMDAAQAIRNGRY